MDASFEVRILTTRDPLDRRTAAEAAALAAAGFAVTVVAPAFRAPAGAVNMDRFRLHRRRAGALARALARAAARHRGRGTAGRLARAVADLLTTPRLLVELYRRPAAVHHVHAPLPLLLGCRLIAAVAGRHLVLDHNDLLAVADRGRVADRYEIAAIWGRPPSPADRRRIRDSLALLPTACSSLLDVGCGDGRMTNAVRGVERVVGLDASRAALHHVAAHRVAGSALELPFAGTSFDAVAATEVVEHFPPVQASRILAEMARVARCWVLIGVPWRENLAAGRVDCVVCGTRFHTNYHHRSFDRRTMEQLLGPHFELFELRLTGQRRRRQSSVLLWLRRRLGGVTDRGRATVCPGCGSHLRQGPMPERNSLSYLVDRLHGLATRLLPADRTHCVGLYRRRSAGAGEGGA